MTYQGKKRLNAQTVNPKALLIEKFSFQVTFSPQAYWTKLTTKAIKLDSNKFPISDFQAFFFFPTFSNWVIK